MDLRAIPRRILDTQLRLARVPLDAAGRIANREENKALWAPSLAFDATEATIKETLGAILRDDTLRNDAALLRAKVDELREAAARLGKAERERLAADAEYQADLDRVEQQRIQAERDAQQQEARVEQERAEAKRAVAEETARKKAATRKAAQAREEAIDKKETASRLEVVEAEAEVIEAQQQAIVTRQEADRLDEAAKRVRTSRKG